MSFTDRLLPFWRNRQFRVLTGLNILLGLAYSFVSPFFSMFGTLEVKMSPFLFSLFMVTTTIAGIVAGTILAHYSDTRFSRRSMLLLGSTGGCLGYLGYAFLRDFASLTLVGCLVLGLSSVSFSQLFAHAREAMRESGINDSDTAFYTNAFRMFFALSWTVGPALASWVMIAFHYTGLFLAAAGCFLLFGLGVWFFIPARPPHGASPKAGKPESIFSLLGRWDLLAHFCAFVLVFASGTIGMMNLPLMVLGELGGTPRDVGVIYSLAPIFELPFMLWFGLLAARVESTKLIRIGLLIFLAYNGLLCLVLAPWHIYPLQVLSAAATAVTAGLAITYFQNFLPGHAGSATNLYSNATRTGSLVGYLLFGSLATAIGHRMIFVCCTGFTVVALLLMQVRREKKREAGSEERE